jgi:hypothetical protein
MPDNSSSGTIPIVYLQDLTPALDFAYTNYRLLETHRGQVGPDHPLADGHRGGQPILLGGPPHSGGVLIIALSAR